MKDVSHVGGHLLVISMLCGNFVGMPTGAAEMVAYCGMEEHTHSEACYCAVQAEGEAAAETLAAAVPTEETAAETTEETTAPTEETALSVSGGSDAQALIGEYVEKELCCGMEEHKHDIACYSNPLADLETAAIWEATLPEKLSGDWGKDLAEVAKSQLGYAESAANYLVGADGETLMGYSRYGAWYSSYTQDEKQAYADWNVPFLFFCLYYAGVTDFPIEEDCADWTAALAAAELWREAAGEYIPEAGDLVFLDTDDDGAADRAAVVTDWDEAKVTAVESDSEGAVKTVTYDLTEDTQVLGYGDTNEAQAKVEVSDGGEAPELFGSLSQTKVVYLNVSNITWWSDASAEMRLFYKPSNSSNWKYSAAAEATDTANLLKITVSDLDISGSPDFHVRRVDPGTVSTGSSSDGTIYNAWTNINADDSKNQLMLYKNGDSHSYSWSAEWIDTGNSGNDDIVDDTANSGTDNGNVPVTVTKTFTGGRVYFNATLSKLSYEGSTSYNCPIPYANSNPRYLAIKSDGNYTEGEMTPDPYRADHYYANIDSGYTHIVFSAYDMTSSRDLSWSGNSTAIIPIEGKYDQSKGEYPCFFADTSDKVVYKSESGNTRGGYWGKYGDIHDAEEGKGTDVVDIPQVAFTPNANTLYVNTTFFDYYTDYELNGANRDTYDKNSNGMSHRNWVTFRQLDQALSSAYSSASVSYPLYVGHFQPNIDGAEFRQIANTLGLYGYDNYNRFFSSNNSNMDESGNLDNKLYLAMQGLIHDTLDGKTLKAKGGNLDFPLFDKEFILGDNSKHTKLGEVYENVAFPFTKTTVNGVEYWGFNSNVKSLVMRQDPNGSYYLQSVTKSDKYENVDHASAEKNTYGFFPFNTGSQPHDANTYNYGFGTRIDLTFRLSDDGCVTNSNGDKVPVTFNFSGDDDVWVFIDGQLALDIGGAHCAVSGSLNFAEKKATVYGVKHGGSVIGQYNSDNPKVDTFHLANTDEHTLTMFYMERGMWESNMSITFNFPDNTLLDVEKEVDTSQVNQELFASQIATEIANEEFAFHIQNQATHFAAQEETGSIVGFVMPQYNVRDYGSVESGTLMNPEGAYYTKSGTTYQIGTDGKFKLKDGQQAFFEDQFRRGSYIYLEEVLTPEQEELFETSWTMYDDSVPVTFFNTGNTVVNPASREQYLVAVAGTKVGDGRKEVHQTGTEQGEKIDNSGYTATAYPKDSSGKTQPAFVFRSYKTPDAVKSSTKLTAKFTNTVRTGTLILSKATAEGSDSLGTEKFKFYIVFTDVGGLDPEGSNSVIKEVELTAGQSETITGIPVNTQYTIYEMKSTDTTISLSKVTVNGEEITAADARYATTAPAPYDSKSISGKIALSGTSGETDTVVFYNTKNAKTSLTLTKKWTYEDEQTGLPDTFIPEDFKFQLQRRHKKADATESDWTPVTLGEGDIETTKSGSTWTLTYKNLDKTETIASEGTSTTFNWEYRVVEVTGNDTVGYTVIKNNETVGDFKVIYGDVTTKDDGSFEQTITNAYIPKITIKVEKVWSGTDSEYTPTGISVKLQRKIETDTGWTDVANQTVTLPYENHWNYEFADQPKLDTEGEAYIYRVVELTRTGENQAAEANDGYIVHDGRLFKVTYADPVTNLQTGDQSFTITNTVQTVKLDITKQSSVAENGVKPTLDGAVFKLEKMTDSSYETLERVIATDVKTQSGGKASFTGLSQGYYLLTETQAAAGYSLLASPIKIEITANVDGTFTIKVDNGTAQTVHADSNGTYAYGLTVYNKPQLVMPSTGGVGGFEFWILGGLLIMAVPLLMYTFIWYRKGGKYLQR